MIDPGRLRSAAPILEALPAATLARVAALAVERSYASGATLYRSGSPANGLYFLLSGRVHVARENNAGSEFLHAEKTGGVLGEIPVFGGGQFPATARAVVPTRCAYLPIEAIERLLIEDTHFARFALRRLADRARALLRRIDELTATTITARLADYVAARSRGSLGKDFTLGMSQEALARELGTAREVVVRGLRALVDAGALERTGRSRFRVRNAVTLSAMSTQRADEARISSR
jgi:CRP/FNR family transcriptional regulator